MRHEAKCHDPHQTLASEDHREDHFDFFQELVDSVCISVRQWSEDLNKKVRVALHCEEFFLCKVSANLLRGNNRTEEGRKP